MKALFEKLREQLQAGCDCALATVIASSGSTPRGAGARMLVGAKGRLAGTVGGGDVEHRTEALALKLLEKKCSYVESFTLSRADVENLGMICGGDVRIFLEYLPGGDGELIALCDDVLQAFAQARDAWLITCVSDRGGMRLVTRETGEAALLRDSAFTTVTGGQELYSEPLVRTGRLIVFGGGHVAQELVPLCARLGFYCIVADDRQDFIAPELFPQAAERLLCDFDRIGGSVAIGKNDYVVVMTRGHAFDYAVQRQALEAQPGYLGVIGSSKKVAAIRERLLADGAQPEAIDRVHSPIGLKILARTPAEIAVSIAAQLIMERARRIEGEQKSAL